MTSFYNLTKNKNIPENMRKIYEIIAGKQNNSKGAKDSNVLQPLTSDEVNQIRNLQYSETLLGMAKDGQTVESLTDVKTRSREFVKNTLQRVKGGRATDGFWNPTNGVGGYTDPSMNSFSYMPVSLSPMEASSLYSNGGLSKVIIDKKSKTLILNGFEFEGNDLDYEDAKRLKDHALKLGFDKALLTAVRDGLIFGGSALIPIFKKDNDKTYSKSNLELISQGIMDKDQIKYFVTADRWNTVVVPDYNITHEDYLSPKTFYIPLGSMTVNTKRASIIKPYPQPYWSAIWQLGWSTSDYTGYVQQVMNYEIMIQTLPMMFQQMSLMFLLYPMDEYLINNGSESANTFMEKNEKEMREWSMVNPKAMNMFGELKTVERNYSGLYDLIQAMRQDIASRSTIPESLLFHTMSTGFADNKDDVTLKQTESIRMIGTEVGFNIKNLIQMLVIDCFGRDSDICKKNINIKFGSPVALTEGNKATIGTQYAQTLSMLVNSGMQLDIATRTANNFFPQVKIQSEDMDRLSEIENEPEMSGQSFGQARNVFNIEKKNGMGNGE